MVKIISYIQSKGAIPVLGTLAPRTPRQVFLNRANAWIMSRGHTYVDFAAALTANRDRVTWNRAFAIGDGVHPNLAGHFAMVAQMRRDAPFLFERDPSKGSPARY
jgi:lysophospholipase L1-like esterase